MRGKNDEKKYILYIFAVLAEGCSFVKCGVITSLLFEKNIVTIRFACTTIIILYYISATRH